MDGGVFRIYLVLTGGINMPNDFPPLTPREINLITENNRLRRGLLLAERQLIVVMKTGKPPHRCAEAPRRFARLFLV